MVTNRARQEIIWIAPKKIQKLFRQLAPLTFLICVQAFRDPLRGELPCPNLHEWWTQPAHMRCPVAQLLIWPKSGGLPRIWPIISEVITVLGRPGRGASQVGKSTRLNWATQFLTVAYDGAYSSNVSVRMGWNSFGALPCRKKKTWWQLASRRCWNRARRLTCFLSASVTRKDL